MVSLVEQRKQRIEAMIDMIRQNQPIEPNKLIKLYSYEVGVRERLARNYLQLLIDIEKVVEVVKEKEVGNFYTAVQLEELSERKET